jgi:hypothetical protein
MNNDSSRQQPLRRVSDSKQRKSRRSTSRGKNPYQSVLSEGKNGFCLTTPSQDALSGGFIRSYVNTEEKSLNDPDLALDEEVKRNDDLA